MAGAQGSEQAGTAGSMPRARFVLRPLAFRQLRAFSLVAILLLIWLGFQFLTHGLFLSPRNLTTLTIQVAVTAMLAAGIVMLMVPGYIDLSIGSATAFTGMVAALLIDPARGIGLTSDPGTVILLTLLAGALIGAWQGFWIAWMEVPAFIVTLASLLALRGAALTVTGGSTASHHGVLLFLAADFLPARWTMIVLVLAVLLFGVTKYIDWRARAASAQWRAGLFSSVVGFPLATMVICAAVVGFVAFSYRGTPLPVAILAGVLGISTFIMSRTVFGRRLYAIGGNPAAAVYAGIDTKRYCFIVFTLMGLLYGLAGLIFDARIGVALPTAGTGLELTVIAAAVIGGTSLFGGTGTPIGAVIGALLLESLNNGMGLMNIESSFQLIVNGLVLLIAVYFDIRSRKTL